jgi:hypothetical protein
MEVAFLTIFGVGLGLLIVTFIVGELFEIGGDLFHDLFDFGGEAHVDLGADASPFSSRILFVFATAFGGFGYIGAAMGWPIWAASALAVAGGLAVAAGTFFVIVLPMSRQQGSTDVHETDFEGLSGQVTSEIPAGGLGRVTVIAPTSKARVALAARSADGERIPFGATVRIEVPGPGPAIVVAVAPPPGAPSPESH